MLTLILAAIVVVAAPVSGANAQAVARALEARYRGARTLKAVFFQSYTDGNGGIQADSGTVYFSRPGRMRWEYESPQRKLFLVDGKNVWFYVPSDRTASRAKLKDSLDWRTPLALLAGKADLSKFCRSLAIVSPGEPESLPSDAPSFPANTVLRCAPRDSSAGPNGPIQEVLFETDPRGFLARITIREPGGAQTEFRFGDWQENIPVAEDKFHFQPPPGVAIVDEETLAGQVQ